MAYHRYHGLDTRIVRIFNTYGPKMRTRDGRVISNFIVQALRNEPLTVYGDGSQTRSFCYVDDLVRGIVALLLAPDETPSTLEDKTPKQPDQLSSGLNIHTPFNIGNPQEVTVLEIANKVLAHLGASNPIKHCPLPVDDPKVRHPNIQRAKTWLKWEPQITLEEGLTKTIRYFQGIL